MHLIPESDVLATVDRHGGRVLEVQRDGAAGTDFESFVYYVIRAG
jgi:hypothetical protein